MLKHAFIVALEDQGAKVTPIKYHQPGGRKSIGFDIEHRGLKVEIEPMEKYSSGTFRAKGAYTEYFVRFSMGNGSQHYTKRGKEGFLPPFCKDIKAFKEDVTKFLME